jgi:hypothetical protein
MPSMAVVFYDYYAVSDVTVNYPFDGPHYLDTRITVRHKLIGLYKQSLRDEIRFSFISH